MSNLTEAVKLVIKDQQRKDKQTLVRMSDKYMARGVRWTGEQEDDFVERMWEVAVRAFPEYARENFNLLLLEDMIESAEDYLLDEEGLDESILEALSRNYA
jgi:hypothetical protein